MFLLSLSGCGHKAEPYYLEKAPKGDDSIEFIIKKPTLKSVENNESCND